MANSLEQLSKLAAYQDGAITSQRITRPLKRNAMNGRLLAALHDFFRAVPEDFNAVALRGLVAHHRSSLNLSHLIRSLEQTRSPSLHWQGVMNSIRFSVFVVVSALTTAVIRGGLQPACATQVRIA